MTDDNGIVRAYSQDRQTYRQPTNAMLKKRTSIEVYRQSDDYYSNRNCPEILSILALHHRHMGNREKRIYSSVANDEHYFNMINYPIQSPPATPRLISPLESLLLEEKQAILPKITPLQTPKSESSTEEIKQSNFPIVSPSESKNRGEPSRSSTMTSNSAKKFPILTPRNPSNTTAINRNPVRTVMKSIPSSTTHRIPMMVLEKNRKSRANTRGPH